jgi:calcineurin-like phosphoesterase family protein
MKNGGYFVLHLEDNDQIFSKYSMTLKYTFETEHNTSIKIERARDADEALRKYIENKDNLDIIITDIVLDESRGTGLEFIDRLNKNSGSISVPIYVLSAHVDTYRYMLEGYQQKQIIKGFNSNYSDWNEEIYNLLLGIDVSLLHISDIHEGKYYAFNKLSKSSNTLISELCKLIMPIDFLCVSGDLSSTDTPFEYQSSNDFLTKISEKTNLEKSQVMLVPGNHDRNRELKDAGLFHNYINFLEDYYGPALDEFVYLGTDLFSYEKIETVFDKLFSIKLFKSLRTIVIGFNSVNYLDNNENSSFKCHVSDSKCGYIKGGYISNEQISYISAELDLLYEKDDDFRNYFKIALFHHNIFEIPHIETYPWRPSLNNQGNLMKYLSTNGFKLILHGHSHYSSAYKFLSYDEHSMDKQVINIVSTGTFSSSERAIDNAFSVNKISYRIDPRGNLNKLVLIKYKLSMDNITWQESKYLLSGT